MSWLHRSIMYSMQAWSSLLDDRQSMGVLLAALIDMMCMGTISCSQSTCRWVSIDISHKANE
jgi:hypothetical protein